MPAYAEGAECSLSQIRAGACDPAPKIEVKPDPDSVTIVGTVDVPGSEDPGGSGADRPAGPPSEEEEPPAVVRDNYTVTAPLSLSDLVNFRPTPGTDHMQPDGWMVVGLDTNFYARATRHVKTGMLLGQPASVRFTPVRYHWTYGDGTSRTTGTPGATWSVLGLDEFDRTVTSHVYAAAGTYYIDLLIGFAPEYRYADSTGWIPIPGIIWVPANRLVAVAGGPKTVLVEDDCVINPSGPGC
jgi:hypothetical protein